MAKELPYFRFTVQDWQNGKIDIERYELKGLFISICGYYWINDCTLTLTMLEKKFSNAKDLIKELVDLDIIKHEKRYDKVEIVFLNMQYDLLSEKRKARQSAGSKGGNAKAKLKQNPSYKDKDNNKEKDKDNIGEKSPTPKTLEERKKEFGLSLEPFLDKYGRVTLTAFFKYWTEHNDGGKKMRFEMEKAFSRSRRLSTWKDNEPKFDVKTKFNTPQTPTIKSHEFNEQ